MSQAGPSALPPSAARGAIADASHTGALKDIVSEMNASPKKPAKQATKQTPPKPARGGIPNGTPPILLSGGNPQETAEQLIGMMEKTNSNADFFNRLKGWMAVFEKEGFTMKA